MKAIKSVSNTVSKSCDALDHGVDTVGLVLEMAHDAMILAALEQKVETLIAVNKVLDNPDITDSQKDSLRLQFNL